MQNLLRNAAARLFQLKNTNENSLFARSISAQGNRIKSFIHRGGAEVEPAESCNSNIRVARKIYSSVAFSLRCRSVSTRPSACSVFRFSRMTCLHLLLCCRSVSAGCVYASNAPLAGQKTFVFFVSFVVKNALCFSDRRRF